MRHLEAGDYRWLKRFIEIAGHLQTQDRNELLEAIKRRLERGNDATLEQLVLSAGHTGFATAFPRLSRAWRRQVDVLWWRYVRVGLKRANSTRPPNTRDQARLETLLLRLSLFRLLLARLTFWRQPVLRRHWRRRAARWRRRILGTVDFILCR